MLEYFLDMIFHERSFLMSLHEKNTVNNHTITRYHDDVHSKNLNCSTGSCRKISENLGTCSDLFVLQRVLYLSLCVYFDICISILICLLDCSSSFIMSQSSGTMVPVGASPPSSASSASNSQKKRLGVEQKNKTITVTFPYVFTHTHTHLTS